jgi:hypothetical protein
MSAAAAEAAQGPASRPAGLHWVNPLARGRRVATRIRNPGSSCQ